MHHKELIFTNLVEAVMGGDQHRRSRLAGGDSVDVDAVPPEQEVHDPVVAVGGCQLKSEFGICAKI